MRTTVEFDSDTAREIERMRTEEGRGLSEAVNELIRRGMIAAPSSTPFVVNPRPLGLRIDVSNIADALDLLEGPQAR